MDFSKFKTNDWLVIGGGLGMFIFGFMNWTKFWSQASDPARRANAFDFFFTGTIPWMLLVGERRRHRPAGDQSTIAKDCRLPWTMIIVTATGLAALLLLIRFLFNPIGGKDLVAAGGSVDRGVGLILSFLSAAGCGCRRRDELHRQRRQHQGPHRRQQDQGRLRQRRRLTPTATCMRPRRSAGPRARPPPSRA